MGKVYIVGAGPGDIDLITVKGLNCIQKADVILYDRLINKELLLHAKKGTELIFVGKIPGFHQNKQEVINQQLVEYAKRGKIVTRLKGGDPFIFGRGAEEAQTLAEHGIPFEIVPGITSGIAAPAYAGIPVTHRDFSSSFAVITGHTKPGNDDTIQWKNLALGVDTLVIYMGVRQLPTISNQLIKAGRSPHTPVAMIYWGTTNIQKTITGTLATIEEIAVSEKMKNPSMIIVGEVVRLRESIRWFEQTLQPYECVFKKGG
ncbi:uroporphyrinogen-III C-methyltransferase [Bacillus sp. SD088]|uniref:uroporphyrinogen-III C-methyltransferase n=1 Tax=Bacillus sp. SD088 TaxID=2782012 RepID=UPI001A973CC6|nr:uroporphyrinogen-III C-methyltransferase [Bacillus sp. SD088]MBO0995110.1 uroporphyrinogen-III C-methyltransferase [Bacillus sp. SD088]